jgi:hypothetical protein
MLKIFNAKAAANSLLKLSKAAKRAAILPFSEQPADNRYNDKQPASRNDDKVYNAADLFSLFTASIIKEDSVFVR